MRLLVLVVTLGLTASAVLEIRHRRLELLHAMAVLHLDMDRHRRAAWELQHRVSRATSPAELTAAIGHAAPQAPEADEADARLRPPGGFEVIPQARVEATP